MAPMTAEKRLRLGFQEVWTKVNFLASIMAPWEIVAKPGIETMGTDGRRLVYEPAFVESLSFADIFDLGVHEAAHIFRGHHLRQGTRELGDWNIACDLSIHGDANLTAYMQPRGRLLVEGLVPGKGTYKDLPMGMSAEWYYTQIHKDPPPQAEPEPQDQGDPQEQEGDEPSEPGAEGAQDPQEGAQDPEGNEEPGQGDGDQDGDGSGPADGDGDDPAEGQGESSGRAPSDIPASEWGKVLPNPTAKEDPEAAQRTWEDQIARGVNDAREAGNLPGWLKEYAESVYGGQSAENWRTHLQRWATKVAAIRRTYQKPSRRHGWGGNGIIMPALSGRAVDKIYALFDTSGSTDESDWNAGLREVEAIFGAHGRAEITMGMCDTRLVEESEIVWTRSDFPMRVPVEWLGRGGTDLGPAIARIAERGGFNGIIVVSDMMWTANRVIDPGIPTIWLATRDLFYDYQTPTFGELVRIPAETPVIHRRTA